MKKHRVIKYLSVILSVLCLFGGNVVSYAESSEASLQVKFITEAGPVTDSEFSIYRVMTPDGKLTGEFADLNIEVGDLTDSENVGNLAYTLASYAVSGDGLPYAVKKTDALGSAGFDGLSSGIYLVTGSSAYIGRDMYTPKPALIRIVGGAKEPVAASVKYTITQTEDPTVEYTVKKVWADSSGASRPASVTAQLLKNGEVYDEQTLSEQNNWSHTWKDLSSSDEWNVIEKDVPEGYTVSISLNDKTFTITNTGEGPKETTPPANETEPPKASDKPQASDAPKVTGTPTPGTPQPSNRPQAYNVPVGNDNPPGGSDTQGDDTPPADTPTDKDKPQKLPQTGQLWWPVPVLLAAGAVLFFTGFITDRLSEDDEKE